MTSLTVCLATIQQGLITPPSENKKNACAKINIISPGGQPPLPPAGGEEETNEKGNKGLQPVRSLFLIFKGHHCGISGMQRRPLWLPSSAW